MDENSKKDIVVGAAGIGTAIATGGTLAGALATLVTLVSVAWNQIAIRDLSKSERLMRRMAEEDEDPDAFVAMLEEKLRDNDEEVLIKLRALIQADLASASPDVYEPIARLGHAYVRGKVESWIARGWVRVFSESSSREIDAFRELAPLFKKVADAADEVEERLRVPREVVGVVLLLCKPTTALTSSPIENPTDVTTHSAARPWALAVFPQLNDYGLSRHRERLEVPTPDASRLFDLLVTHGIASTRADMFADRRNNAVAPDERSAIQLTRESARALAIAFGV